MKREGLWINKLGAENFKKYANLGPLFGDIRTIFLGDLPTWVTSIIAGPPCKPTSATGSRKGADAADTSTYWAVLHWCCFLFINSPVFRFAIIENVSDILKSFGEYKICLASQIEAYIEHSMKPAIAFWIPKNCRSQKPLQRRRLFLALFRRIDVMAKLAAQYLLPNGWLQAAHNNYMVVKENSESLFAGDSSIPPLHEYIDFNVENEYPKTEAHEKNILDPNAN